MSLPLPNYLSEEQGGGILNSMSAGNALANANHLRRYNKAKADYGPQTLMAEAASKLAYANLMGPQFLAKAMADPNFMGNLNEQQKKEINRIVNAAGTGQGTGKNALSLLPQQQNTQSQNPIAMMLHKLGGALGLGQQQGNAIANLGQQPIPQQGSNAFNQPTPAPQLQQNQPRQGSLVDENGTVIDQNGDLNTPVTPEQAASLEALNREGNPSSNPMPMTLTEGNKAKESIPEGTYEKKGGKYQGRFEEEKEMGKIRAKQREELDNQIEQAIASEAPVKHLGEIIKNPMFQNMRKFPWFQKLQLGIKSTNGSREEQKLIGDFQTTAMKAVAETIKSFGGRILDKEVTLANDMKISPNDTIGVIVGKYPSIVAFNEMTKQRASIASRIMKDEGVSKGEALQRADKQVNGEAIRARVEKDIEGYPSREDIEHTAKVRGITTEEVIKRLKAAGKYHG